LSSFFLAVMATVTLGMLAVEPAFHRHNVATRWLGVMTKLFIECNP